MQNRWPTRWLGWASISRIAGILAGLIALALAGRKVVAHRTREATERKLAMESKEKAVLAEAGIEKARYEAKVIAHSEAAMKHEEAATDYEGRIKAAKARVARLRGRA